MNTPEAPRPSLWRFAWLAVPLGLFLMAGALVVGVTGYFRLSRDAQCLRNSLTQGGALQAAALKKKIELHVGPFTCYAIRAGLSFAPLEPDVREALRAVQGGEVGVYQVNQGFAPKENSSLLEAADRAMTGRGWDRLVGVARKHELVAIYVPQQQSASANLRTCVAVLNRDDLVIVSARSNLEPLLELASKMGEERRGNWQAAFPFVRAGQIEKRSSQRHSFLLESSNCRPPTI